MRYLLDTMVISDLSKEKRHPTVVRFLQETDSSQMFLSVVTIGEIADGLHRLPFGKKRDGLFQWFAQTRSEFEDRTYIIDDEVSTVWGQMSATVHQQGGKLDVVDGLIAATALVHDLAVVTRNVKDFEGTGVQIVNPWDDAS